MNAKKYVIASFVLLTSLFVSTNTLSASPDGLSRDVTVGEVDEQYTAEVSRLKAQEQVVLAPETGQFEKTDGETTTGNAIFILVTLSIITLTSINLRRIINKRKRDF